jgi:sirohydrochlorin cobaltochelatase
MSKNTALILIPHGSKNAEWIAPFRQWTEDLRRELGSDAVYLCFMEIAEPKLMDVAREIMGTPVRHARLLPLFLSKGSHFLVDIPRQMAEVNAVFPELEMELLEPIGLHPLFFDLMRQVIKSL